MSRRWAVAFLGLVAGLAVLLVLGLVGFSVFLQTGPGQRWATDRLEDLISNDKTTATIGSVHTDLWTGARIEDFRLERDGMVISAGRIDADLDRSALLGGQIVLRRAVADGALVDFTQPTRDPDEPVEPFSGIGTDLVIEEVVLRGTQVRYRNTAGDEVVRLTGASGTARFQALGDTLTISDIELGTLLGLQGSVAAHLRDGTVVIDPEGTHLRGLDLDLPQSALTIDGSVQDEIGLDIAVERAAGSDLDMLLGHPGIAGDLAGSVQVEGPTTVVRWSADVRGIDGTKGTVVGTGTVDLTTEKLGWTIDANLSGIDVKQVYPGTGESIVLTGRADVSGVGTAWPDDIEIDVSWSGSDHEGFGQRLEGVTATIRVENGAVVLEQTALDGILGELQLTGRVETVTGPLDLRATGLLQPHRLRELGVGGIDSSGWLDARIRGDLTDPDTPTRITGSVRFAPFRSGDSIRFDEAIATFDVRQLGERVDGTAEARGTGGDVAGMQITEVEIPEVEIHTGPNGTDVSGNVGATGLSMPDTLSATTASGTWAYSDRGTTAQIALGTLDVMGMAGTGGRISVDQREDMVSLDIRLDDQDRTLARTEGTWNLATSRLELGEFTLRPTGDTVWTILRPLAMTVTDGGVGDAEITLQSDLGTIEVVGTIGSRGPLDGTVTLSGMQLRALTDLDPIAYGQLTGEVDMDLTLSGDASAPRISGRIQADGVGSGLDLQELDMDGRFETTERELEGQVSLAVDGAPVARVDGTLPISLDLEDPKLSAEGMIDLMVSVLPGGTRRFEQLSPSAGELPKGELSGILELTGPIIDPNVRMAGVYEVEVPGWEVPQRTEFEITRSEGMLSGWADLRAGHQRLGQAFGLAHTGLEEVIRYAIEHNALPEDLDATTLADDIYVSGVFSDVPMDLFARAGGFEHVRLEGGLAGGFEITGTPEKPLVSGSVNWLDGKIGRQSVDTFDLTLSNAERAYSLDMDIAFPNGQRLGASGRVPLEIDLNRPREEWASEEMAFTIEGSVPMRALTPLAVGVSRSEGDVIVDGRIGGTAFDPDPEVRIGIQRAAIRLIDLGLRVEDLALEASANRDGVIIETLTGTTAPTRARVGVKEVLRVVGEEDLLTSSRFELRGEVGLDGGTPTDVALKAKLEGGTWVVATANNAIRLDGKLKVGGTYPELVVGGNLVLREGKVKLDAAAFVDKAPLEVDPRIHIAGRTLPRSERAVEAPWYSDVQATLNLDLRRNMELEVYMPFVDDLGALGAFVSSADLNARLGGQAQLVLANAVPTMIGEVDLNDGRLKILGRRFDVDSGRITFAGGDISEPQLQITSSTTVAQVPVTATVSGTPSAPEIVPECEDIGNQSDCLMLLFTGRKPGDSSTSADSGDDAVAEAETSGLNSSNTDITGALTGMALSSALGAQNVADISIETDGSFEVGAHLFNWLYMRYAIDPTAEQFVENKRTLEADIGISRRLGINLATGDQLSWGDLFWELRF